MNNQVAKKTAELDPKELIDEIKKSLPDVFKDRNEQKEFLSQLTSLYLNNKKLKNLDKNQVLACALQLFLKGANMENGEGFIIGYDKRDKKTGQVIETVATTQTGYKYAIKKLYESGELLKYPDVAEIKKGDLDGFNPITHEAKIKTNWITSEEEFKTWQAAPVVGYQVKFEMKDPNASICKFFWKSEIDQHIKKYSDSFNKNQRWHNPHNIWSTNPDEMRRKNALMRAYTKYLPKTENKKLYAVTKDIDALNFAAYDKIDRKAPPHYIDNPHNDNQRPAPKVGGLTPDLQVPPSGITPKADVNNPPLFYKDLPNEEKSKLTNHRLISNLTTDNKKHIMKMVWEIQTAVKMIKPVKTFSALPVTDFYKLLRFLDGFKDQESLRNYITMSLNKVEKKTIKDLEQSQQVKSDENNPGDIVVGGDKAQLDEVNNQIVQEEANIRDNDDLVNNIDWSKLG